MTTLLQALDDLKAKGFSPTDRAIVAHEWMKWGVHFHGSKPEGHFTKHHERSQQLFDLFQQTIASLESPKQLTAFPHRAEGKEILRELLLANVEQVFGVEKNALKDNQDERIKFMKQYVNELSSERFSNMTRDDWLQTLVGGPVQGWKTIQEMEMDEDDLQVYLSRKMPQPSAQFPAPSDITLEHSHALLDEALKRAQIPVCALDEFTATSPSACFTLSKHIHRVCDAVEHLGVEACGLNAIHMRVDYPYAEGFSGQMDAYHTPQPTMPVATPVVSLSNQCGWEYDEVIIHELLHAHDALLSNVAHQENTGGRLLSYESEKTKSKDSEALHKAWMSLAHQIDHLTSSHDVEQKKQQARQGISQRWASMGVDPEQLELAIQAWEQSSDKKKDKHLHKQVTGLFAHTPFAASADFRSNVIVAECKLLDKIGEQPVFQTFIKEFDNLHVKETNKKDAYGRGYFENLSEKMARAIQSSLDVLPDAQQADNPYAKRWLVYADQSLSQDITKCWQEFFQTPCVQEAYDVMRTTAPDLGNIKERLMAARARRASQPSEPDVFKKAAL